MTRTTLAICSLLTACLAQGACTETEISGNTIFAAKQAEGELVALALSVAFDGDAKLFMRLNGQDVWWHDSEGRSESRRATLESGLYMWLPSGEYRVELVDRAERVVMKTTALVVAPGRVNSLLIYGSPVSPAYLFHNEDPSGVPAGKIRYITGNVGDDQSPAQILDCGGDWFARTDCKELAAALPWGESIKAELSHRRFLVVRQGSEERLEWAIERSPASLRLARVRVVYLPRLCPQWQPGMPDGPSCTSYLMVDDGMVLRD